MSRHLLLAEAMSLPVEERKSLALELLRSVEDPDSVTRSIEDAQFAEVERRWQAIQDGREKTIPWDQVRAELLADED